MSKNREQPWRDLFHSYHDFKKAAPIGFAIEGFLQNDATTLIGGLSGHGKTWIMLEMAKLLLSRKSDRLWNQFEVPEYVKRVIYLIPESGIRAFKHRLKLFHLFHYLKEDRLLVHTLSKGPIPKLNDPRLLAAAKGARIFLDTAVRFGEGDESKARDNQEGLATALFDLERAGARSIVGAHHAPKSFARENVMTLENILRGSGDIGAMVATVWGIKQLDPKRNIIHIENVKARDFDPCGPFQIIGRPYINEEGHFHMHKKPGECGALANEQNQGGAPPETREEKARNLAKMGQWLQKDPKLTNQEVEHKFKSAGIKLADSTIRKYRMILRNQKEGK